MVRPVSVRCGSARALGGSGGNGVTLHPGRLLTMGEVDVL